MKKIALFMAAAGFLAFSGLARAEEPAPPAGAEQKAPKKATKSSKKEAPAAGEKTEKTEKKAETK
jgi:hypothetical protein